MALTMTPTVAASAGTIETTLASSASYTEATTGRSWGVTLNTAHPVGQFADGNYFVVTTSSGSVTATTPASVEENGYVKNGVQKDPFWETDQGVEAMWGVSFSSVTMAYNSVKNIAPGVHGNGPITWEAGDEFSLLCVLRKSGVTTPSRWDIVDTAITITFVPTAPPVGTLMPAASQLAPKTLFNENDFQSDVWRALTFPPSWSGETTANLLGDVPHDLMRYGANNVDQRRVRLDINLGTTTSNYDSQVTGNYAKLVAWRHNAALTGADKLAIDRRIARNAIQVYGAYTRGYSALGSFGGFGGGAGQCDSGTFWMWNGSFLFGNGTMLAAAKDAPDMMEAQCAWADLSYVGRAVTANENGDGRKAYQTFFSEHVGMPFTFPTAIGSNHDTLYGVLAQKGTGWYNLVVAMLQNGPSGETGPQAQLRGGAFASSNEWARGLGFLNRYRYWNPWYMGSNDPGGDYRDLYDLVWPLTGLTELALVPDQIPANGITLSTPGEGQIGFDTTATGYSNGTAITLHNSRYSLDGVQWVEVADTGAVGTLTGLRKGILHLYSIQAANANGTGLWSANYPDPGDPVRNTITTTGTESAAPAFDGVDPAINAQIHPSWWATSGNYQAASGTLDDDQVRVAAGHGYPSGNFTLAHYGFQWKRGTEDIAGATSQFYDRQKADAGTDLSCVVTIDNGVDPAVSHTTTAVTAPALNVLAATKLISTDFAPTFIVDYEDEWLAATVSSADLLHLPGYVADGDVVHSTGGLHLRKTSTYPSFRLPCQNTAVAGTTYTVTAQVVHSGTANANPSFNVINAAGSSVLTGGSITIVRDTSTGDQVENITAEIVVAGGETDLDFRVQLAGGSSSGATGGGSPYLTNIDITAV